MSLSGLFLLRDSTVRALLAALGAFFVAVAIAIVVFHPWQAGESRLVLLVPLLSGVALIGFATFLKGTALRVAAVAFVFAMPPVLWALAKVGCAVGWLSGATCA